LLPVCRQFIMAFVRNRWNCPIAKLFNCRFYRVEMKSIALGDGSAFLMCLDCEMIALDRKAARARRRMRFSARAEAASPSGLPAPRSRRDSAPAGSRR
jgi:hypothetical protein